MKKVIHLILRCFMVCTYPLQKSVTHLYRIICLYYCLLWSSQQGHSLDPAPDQPLQGQCTFPSLLKTVASVTCSSALILSVYIVFVVYFSLLFASLSHNHLPLLRKLSLFTVTVTTVWILSHNHLPLLRHLPLCTTTAKGKSF